MKQFDPYIPIAVHGVPRSGTSWIGEIFNSSPQTVYRYQPLFSYAHKDYLTSASTREDIDNFFRRIRHCNDEFTNQTARRKAGDYPTFNKKAITHVIYKEVRYNHILFNLMRKTENVFLCALIRNPLSVINSWLRAPREFRKDLGWSEADEWRYALKKNLNRPEEYFGFEKWKEAANTFLQLEKEFPERVYILRYEKLLNSRIQETQKLFRFLQIDFTEQTERFLKNSSSADKDGTYAVFRKNQTDDKWKTELDKEIAAQIFDDLKGTNLETFID